MAHRQPELMFLTYSLNLSTYRKIWAKSNIKKLKMEMASFKAMLQSRQPEMRAEFKVRRQSLRSRKKLIVWSLVSNN